MREQVILYYERPEILSIYFLSLISIIFQQAKVEIEERVEMEGMEVVMVEMEGVV